MGVWQVCPLGPTGYGDSPYQCFSAFAGNPYFIDMIELSHLGLLPFEKLSPLLFLPSDRVDYASLYKVKWEILFSAFDRFYGSSREILLPYGSFTAFKEKNAFWLDSFSLFQALKEKYGGRPWFEWPTEMRTYARVSKQPADTQVERRAEAHRFFQYLFFGQWKQLKTYANERGVEIMGDIPIFVSHDSADVWTHPELFQLDPETGKRLRVAGVPPDYFSDEGQLWGNPLYKWDVLKNFDYKWWMDRFRMNFELYDIMRLDHFRGFQSYWSVSADESTARNGKWVKGPGLDFFKTTHRHFPDGRLVAEDLGTLSEEVMELREQSGMPGMAVLQFAFGGESDNFYLPHNHAKNTVVYSGTHDNNTTVGWYETAEPELQDHVRRYLRISGEEISWDFIRSAYSSPARLAVFPLQDLMSLDEKARFNRPGESQGNWQWRYSAQQLDQLEEQSADYLRELADLYGRQEDVT